MRPLMRNSRNLHLTYTAFTCIFISICTVCLFRLQPNRLESPSTTRARIRVGTLHSFGDSPRVFARRHQTTDQFADQNRPFRSDRRRTLARSASGTDPGVERVLSESSKDVKGLVETVYEGDDSGNAARLRDGVRGKHSFSPEYMPYEPPPEDFEVVHVSLFLRHGDRTPISKTVGAVLDVTNDIELWQSLLPSDEDMENWDAMNPVEPEDIASRPYDYGKAPFGQLTVQGARECQAIGADFRQRYIEDQEILPHNLAADKIKARTTNLRRTQQSLQNFLLGLYPEETRDPSDPTIPISTCDLSEETLIPDSGHNCPKFVKMARNLALEARQSQKIIKAEREIMRGLGYPPGGSKWAQAREVLTCYLLQNKPLPNELGEQEIDRLGYINGYLWGYQYRDMEVGRLATGRIFAEVFDDMVNAMDDDDAPQLSVYAGHDSTLVPILCALGVYDDQWPPYASNVALELAQDKRSGDFWVRVLYNNSEQLLMDGFWNRLEDFANYMGYYTCTEKEWQNECNNVEDELGLDGGVKSDKMDDDVLPADELTDTI